VTGTTTKADDRPLLARAEAAIDGLAEAQEALRRVREHTAAPDRGPPASVLAPGVLLSRVADAIVGGAEVPGDLALQLLAAENAERERAAGRDALRAIKVDLEQRLQSARAAGTDRALGVVRDELEDVLARTREVDGALGAVRTPEAAMAAGSEAIEAWQRLLALVDRYDQVRAAQLHLIRSELGGGGAVTDGAFARGGIFANMYDLNPELQARATHRRPADLGFTDSFMVPPWPAPDVEPGDHLGPWPTTDRPAFLRWVATSEAEAWVPTVAQLKAKVEEVAQWIRNGGPPEQTEPATPTMSGNPGLSKAAFDRERKKIRDARYQAEDEQRRAAESWQNTPGQGRG